MAIEVIDTIEVANRERKRTVVMNTRKLHSWVHYYANPGDHDELQRKAIKVGMTCTFTYASAGSTAKKIDCKG